MAPRPLPMSPTKRPSAPRAAALPLFLLGALAGCNRGGTEDPAPGPRAGEGDKPDIEYLVGPTEGRWVEPREIDRSTLTPEQIEQLEKLEDLGYSGGLHADERSGVTLEYQGDATGQVLQYTPAHTATSLLIDRDNTVLHRWSYPWEKLAPDEPVNKLQSFWRRTHLLPNGDLLAIYEGQGIIKIDKDSNLLWSNRNRAHHDLEVLEDGSIYVLTREPRKYPILSEDKFVLEDFITILDADGKVQRKVSLLKAMRGTPFDQNWRAKLEEHLGGDLMHTNTLEVLDGSLEHVDPAFRAGNVMISSLLLHLVAIVDMETEKVVWGQVGPYRYQHDPQVLPNGRVLVFDNRGGGTDEQPGSRVLELDPATWEPVWSFEGSAAWPFYSQTCGLVQRLADGHTLITESDYGRAFEVDADGNPVWEFYNPHRAGENDEFIATLMEMVVVPEDLLGWMED